MGTRPLTRPDPTRSPSAAEHSPCPVIPRAIRRRWATRVRRSSRRLESSAPPIRRLVGQTRTARSGMTSQSRCRGRGIYYPSRMQSERWFGFLGGLVCIADARYVVGTNRVRTFPSTRLARQRGDSRLLGRKCKGRAPPLITARCSCNGSPSVGPVESRSGRHAIRCALRRQLSSESVYHGGLVERGSDRVQRRGSEHRRARGKYGWHGMA